MTSGDLLAALEQDIAWRQSELGVLLRELSDDNTLIARSRRRSMVPIIQSHAEGFVRFALSAYLRFISSQGSVVRDLREVHVAWMLSAEFNRVRVNSVDDDFSRTGIDNDNKKARLHYAETRFLESLGSLLEAEVRLDDSPLDKFDQT